MTSSSPVSLLSIVDRINIIRAEHYVARSALYGPPHSHEDQFQFAYVVSGSGTVYMDGTTYRVGPGWILFSPPGLVHASIGDSQTLYELFEVCFGVDDPNYRECVPHIPPACTTPQANSFIPCLERLVATFTAEGSSSLSKLRLAEMLVLLSRAVQHPDPDSVPASDTAMRCRQAVDHIAQHYREPVRVDELADIVGMSPSHFASVFRQSVGCSPMELVIRTRIHQAKELLRYSSQPIAQIAEACGFSSPQYFSKLFSAREGVSPLTFRTQHRNGK